MIIPFSSVIPPKKRRGWLPIKGILLKGIFWGQSYDSNLIILMVRVWRTGYMWGEKVWKPESEKFRI